VNSALTFPSPKLGAGDRVDTWYRYYAGYSAQFVNYALTNAAPGAHNVLDPWNGTGTTTVVAAGRATASFGFDINPAAVIVARARLLDDSVEESIEALTNNITSRAHPERLKDDPLSFWFSQDSAAQLRALQIGIHRLLVDSSDSDANPTAGVNTLSSLAAFFYVALFRTVRQLIAPTAGSNPTWWKRPDADKLLRIPKSTILATFSECSEVLRKGLHRSAGRIVPATRISVSDSRLLPLDDDSVEAVVSSPPYCTRIDYGISMRPELAVLRFSEEEMKTLRNRMVGTPTMTDEWSEDKDLGALASEFLAGVKSHASQASSTYYLKYFRQYYTAMHASIAELKRVTRDGAPVLLVVQDSFYKELHNDTPAVLAQMASMAGFQHTERHDFHIPRTKAAVNPRVRKYRSEATATESVILFR
jgi:hypothetical protein